MGGTLRFVPATAMTRIAYCLATLELSIDQVETGEMGAAMGQVVAPATVKLDSGFSVVLFVLHASIYYLCPVAPYGKYLKTTRNPLLNSANTATSHHDTCCTIYVDYQL